MDNPALISDEDIARQVQNGDAESFGELVRRYERKILRYAEKFLLQDSAEDLAQEVFIKAYRNIQSFNPGLKFSPWLYRIAHNEFINELERRQRRPLSFFDPDTLFPHPVAPETAERETELAQIRQQLEFGLGSLAAKYREALILYFLEELSYKEIADVLKIPIATVGVRISRAKTALREIYQNHPYGQQ